MGPDELDDLLNNNGAESGKGSALALYEGTREEDLVDEEIDERVLGLLGLEDVFDIDYGTYITLLKERLAASRNFEKKLSSEEDELLVSEFRRVKGKVGRFKLKKRKVTSEDIGVTGPIKVSSSKFLLAGKAVIPEREATESSSDIADIQKSLDAILKTLTLQNKEKKKASEDERKKLENRRRRQREGELEKPLTQLKSLAKKIIAPAQGILDRIFRFIKFTLLGYAFNQLVNWFNDPKNEEKVKVLGRFLKDWWPSLLFAYGLFATPFGKFVRITLRALRRFIPRILKILPQLAKFAIKNPGTLPIVAATVGGIAKIKESERLKPVTQKSQEEIDKTLQSKESPWYQKLGASFAGQSLNAPGGPVNPIGLSAPGGTYSGGGLVKPRSFFGGGLIQKEIDAKDIAFEGGGGITKDTGVKIKGAGVDTQLIAARPGEVMISKEAVDKYGANFFLGLNKKGGGTNIPRMVNNIQLAAGGGLIKKPINVYQGGGVIGGAGATGTSSGSGGMFSRYQSGNQGKDINKMVSSTPSSPSNLPTTPTTDYPLSNKERGAILQLPVQKSLKMNEYQVQPKGLIDFMLPSSSRTQPVPDSDYPPTSYDKEDFQKGVRYNPLFQGLMRFPYIESKPREDVDYKMDYVPSDYDQFDPEYNTIQANNISPKNKPFVPGPPVIYTKTTYTILPPIKAPSKGSANIPRGSTLPEFSASSSGDYRSKIAIALGIEDLVGVV